MLTTLPEYTRIDGKPFDPAIVKWVSPLDPPPIGARIRARMNRLGFGKVVGYFVEYNFLGVLVEFEDPPKWYVEQNGPNCLGHLFGPEMELAVQREFAFDVRLFATIRVPAATEAEARRMLRAEVDAATANFGAWPNGDAIVAEVSVDDDHPDLIEIDGEAV